MLPKHIHFWSFSWSFIALLKASEWLTICLTFMCVCVACRFVILLSDDRDYFFILYMVYVGVNMLLAGIALLHWPGSEQLELVNNPDGYQVSF